MNEALVHLGQFGVAGLIGVMWMLERRAAATRARQIDEAHERLLSARREADALYDVVRENTRAVASLEASQRELVSLLRLMIVRDGAGANRADRGATHAGERGYATAPQSQARDVMDTQT